MFGRRSQGSSVALLLLLLGASPPGPDSMAAAPGAGPSLRQGATRPWLGDSLAPDPRGELRRATWESLDEQDAPGFALPQRPARPEPRRESTRHCPSDLLAQPALQLLLDAPKTGPPARSSARAA